MAGFGGRAQPDRWFGAYERERFGTREQIPGVRERRTSAGDSLPPFPSHDLRSYPLPLARRRVVAAGPGRHLPEGPGPPLLDNFNRPDSPAVGPGWVETETTAGTGAAIVGDRHQLSSGVSGRDFGLG